MTKLCFDSLKPNFQNLSCLYSHIPIQFIIKSFWICAHTEFNSISKLPQLPTSPKYTVPLPPGRCNGLLSSLFQPCCISDYRQITARVILWTCKSHHVAALHKPQKWLPVSLREKPRGSALWALSWCSPPPLWLPPHLLPIAHSAADTLVFPRFPEHVRMLLPCSRAFLSSFLCLPKSFLRYAHWSLPHLLLSSFKCDLFDGGAFLTAIFKTSTLSTHLNPLIPLFCSLSSAEQISPSNNIRYAFYWFFYGLCPPTECKLHVYRSFCLSFYVPSIWINTWNMIAEGMNEWRLI